MKTKLIAITLLFTIALCSSCSKEKSAFDYPMTTLYGTWKAVSIQSDGKWYDVTKYPYTKFGMSITFYKDGTFYGSGYFGNGSGTYKAKGKTITTYIDGKEYFVYTVNSLSNDMADLNMSDGKGLIRIKAEKQYY